MCSRLKLQDSVRSFGTFAACPLTRVAAAVATLVVAYAQPAAAAAVFNTPLTTDEIAYESVRTVNDDGTIVFHFTEGDVIQLPDLDLFEGPAVYVNPRSSVALEGPLRVVNHQSADWPWGSSYGVRVMGVESSLVSDDLTLDVYVENFGDWAEFGSEAAGVDVSLGSATTGNIQGTIRAVADRSDARGNVLAKGLIVSADGRIIVDGDAYFDLTASTSAKKAFVSGLYVIPYGDDDPDYAAVRGLLRVTGGATVEADNTVPGARADAYGIAALDYSEVNVGRLEADLYASVESQTGEAQAIGIMAWSQVGVPLVNVGSADIRLTAESLNEGVSSAYGVTANDGGRIRLGASTFDVTALSESPAYAYGVYSSAGTVEIESGSIKVVSEGRDLVGEAVGFEALEGALIRSGSISIDVQSPSYDALGIRIGDANSRVELSGDVAVRAQSGADAYGIVTHSGGALVMRDGRNLSVSVTGAQYTTGIHNTTRNGAFGTVDIDAPVTIDVQGERFVVGIANTPKMSDSDFVAGENDGIFLRGPTTVNVRASGEGASAIGFEVENVVSETGKRLTASEVFVRDLTLTVTADNGASAMGVLGLGGSLITFSGTNSITINAPDATAIYLSNTPVDGQGGDRLTVDGSLDVRAASGIIMDAGAELVLTEGSSASFPDMLSSGTVSLSKGSTLSVVGRPNRYTSFGTIRATNALINIGAGFYDLDSLKGEGNTLRFTNLADNSGVTFASPLADFSLAAAGTANDQFASPDDAARAVLEAVTFTDPATTLGVTDLVVEEGAVNDGLTARVGEDGTLSNVRVTENTKLSALGSLTLLGAFQWRHDMTDLSRRAGELRDAPQGVGTWVRAYGTNLSYGGVDNTNSSIQVGADTDAGGGWKLGAAFSYTDVSSDLAGGSAESDAYGLALYGTYLKENGAFVDLIAKMSRLESDFTIREMTGSIDNNAWSVSVEAGHRFAFADRAFVEPQIALTYGRVSGDDFVTGNGVRVQQDDFTSLVGRAGARAGFFLPGKKGTLYARFSVLNDFEGELDTLASTGNARKAVHDDIGGTWVEYGVGANFNFTPSTYGYVDFERTSGGEVSEDWRWNAGIKYVF